MSGVKIGRLLVMKRVAGPNGRAWWKCQCECGAEITVDGKRLRQKHTRSCGCLRVDFGRSKRTHGHTAVPGKTREYRSWQNMKKRCLVPTNTHFKDYGGRGIRICERWMVFDNFIKDMGRCPPGYSIERTNNDRNYEPGNCRWATQDTQCNNKRSNITVDILGAPVTVAQAARFLSLNFHWLMYRVRRAIPMHQIANPNYFGL